MYRYRVNYGLSSDERARTAFIVDYPDRIAERASDIANVYYDNMVEQGVIFDYAIGDHVKQIRKEIVEDKTDWTEEDIWVVALSRYLEQRHRAIWYNFEEIN